MTESNGSVLGSGLLTFNYDDTLYGGIRCSAAGTVELLDSDGSAESKVTLSNVAFAAPSVDADPATKAYVDGRNAKTAVRAATTEDVIASAAGTGTLTIEDDASGFVQGEGMTVDGVLLLEGDRLLVKDGVIVDSAATTSARNGIYIVGDTSDVTLVLTRAADANTFTKMSQGASCVVVEGDDNGATGWVNTTVVDVLDVDAITFVKFADGAGGSGSSYTVNGQTLISAALADADTFGVYAGGEKKCPATRVATYVQSKASALTFGDGLAPTSLQTFTTSLPLAITDDSRHMMFFAGATGVTALRMATVTTVTNGDSFVIGASGKPAVGDRIIVVQHNGMSPDALVALAMGAPAFLTLTDVTGGGNYDVDLGKVYTTSIGPLTPSHLTVFSFTGGSDALVPNDFFDLSQSVSGVNVYGTKGASTGTVTNQIVFGRGVYSAAGVVTAVTVATGITDVTTYTTGVPMTVNLDIDGLVEGTVGPTSLFPMDENGNGAIKCVNAEDLSTYVQSQAGALSFGSGLSAGDLLVLQDATSITNSSQSLYFLSGGGYSMDVSALTAISAPHHFTIDPFTLGSGNITLLVIKQTGSTSSIAVDMVPITEGDTNSVNNTYNATTGIVRIEDHELIGAHGDHYVFAIHVMGPTPTLREGSFTLGATVSSSRFVLGTNVSSEAVGAGDVVVGKDVYEAAVALSMPDFVTVGTGPAAATYTTGMPLTLAVASPMYASDLKVGNEVDGEYIHFDPTDGGSIKFYTAGSSGLRLTLDNGGGEFVGSWSSTASDEKWKNLQGPVSADPLSDLDKVDAQSWTWKEGYQFTAGEFSAGIVAQQFQLVCPAAVKHSANQDGLVVDYNAVHSFNLSCIKALKQENIARAAAISALEQENAARAAAISALEQENAARTADNAALLSRVAQLEQDNAAIRMLLADLKMDMRDHSHE